MKSNIIKTNKIILFIFILILSLNCSKIIKCKATTIIGTPEEFGAIVNDGKDDTTAIQKALNKYGVVKLKDGGVYNINKTLTINKSMQVYSSTKNPATIIMSGSASAIKGKASVKQTIKIKQSLNKGITTIKLPTNTNVSNNDLIHIKSNKLWYWDNRDSLYKGELHSVSSFKNGIITLSEGMFDNYASTEELTITIYKESEIILQGINFKHPSAKETVMLEFEGFTNSKYYKLNIENSKKIGLLVKNNYKSTIDANTIKLNTTKDIPTGYGIQDYGGTKNTFKNNYITKVRRGIDASGKTPSYYALIEGNKAIGQNASELATGSSGFGSHSTAVNTIYKNNTSQNFKYGFVLRGKNQTVENNTIINPSLAVVEVAFGSTSIVNNNISKGNSTPYFLYCFKGFNGSAKITNNTSYNTNKWFNTNIGVRTSGNKKM